MKKIYENEVKEENLIFEGTLEELKESNQEVIEGYGLEIEDWNDVIFNLQRIMGEDSGETYILVDEDSGEAYILVDEDGTERES